MDNKGLLALKFLADLVNQSQNCVLELIIRDDGMLAHLIPLEAWEKEMEGEEDDPDDY